MMNTRRLLPLLLALLCLALPACAEEALAPDARVVVLATGVDINAILADVDVPAELMHNIPAYVDSLTDGLLMLAGDRADAFGLPYDTARYVASRNEGLLAFTLDDQSRGDLHLLMTAARADAMAAFNDAIAALREDGALDALYTEHVDAVIGGAEPVAAAMPVFDGADTLIVGVSGDTPPYDYTTADGAPAGFNTALLAALAEHAQVNIEIVPVEGSARFSALSSGRIDAFFCHVGISAALPGAALVDEAVSAGGQFLVSDPYMSIEMGLLIPRP